MCEAVKGLIWKDINWWFRRVTEPVWAGELGQVPAKSEFLRGVKEEGEWVINGELCGRAWAVHWWPEGKELARPR